MKELSIEEKAKAYDEALERARLYKGLQAEMSVVFPELAESEDKRMIKSINRLISHYYDVNFPTPEGFTREELVSWLEKQGEHANFRNKIQIGDKVTRNEDGVLVNLSQLNRVAKKDEKQGEQKPTPKFRVGDKIWHKNYKGECMHHIIRIENNNYIGDDNTSISISTADKEYELVEKQGEKKHTDWSKEDEKIYQSIMDDTVQENQLNDKQTNWLRDIKYRYFPLPKQEWSEEDKKMLNKLLAVVTLYYGYSGNDLDKQSCTSFLKSLKDRIVPQLKQVWSEEDDSKLKEVLYYIEYVNKTNVTFQQKNLTHLINWLKSLRPQSQWRPSDAQMESIKQAVSNMKNSACYDSVLVHLLRDLEKLREE